MPIPRVLPFMLLVFVLAAPSTVRAADPVPADDPGAATGSKTSGLGTATSAQPSPAPSIAVGPNNIPAAGGAVDTPGKTGLGNTGRDTLGGAMTGPGTKAAEPAPVPAPGP